MAKKLKAITTEPLTKEQRERAATCVDFAYSEAIRVGNSLGFQEADVEDAAQDACLGVMRASKDYDATKAKFSTHASWWIRSYLGKHASGRSVVHIPYYLAKFRRDGVNPKTGRAVPELTFGRGGDPGDFDLLEEVEAPPPECPLERSEEWELLAGVLAKLTEVERNILTWRFGLGNGNKQTLDAIGRKIGRTRERVRQIEVQTIRKIRKLLGVSLEDGPLAEAGRK